jgi:hypothetical protein
MMQHLRPGTQRIALVSVIALAAMLIVVTAIALAANTIVWQAASTGLPTSGLNRDVAFGDVNNDGKPDMIIAGGNGVAVYIGDGTGNWNGAGFSTGLPVAGQYWHVIVADFNRDGKLDIAASQSSSGPVSAWTGDGAGNWTAWAGLPSGTYEGIAAADVNKDGRPDLIVAGGAPVYQGIHVFLSTGASFSETTPITTTGQYYDVAADYVDGDGSIDVVAAGQAATGGLKFWRGNYGSGWIYDSAGLTTTNTFRGVTFGDVDLDGKPELIASRFGFPSSTGGGLFIYKYDATTNTWSLAPNQISLTNSYYKLELGDLNNDGRLDLVAGGGSTTGSSGLFTYLGSQTGFISVTPPITSGSLDRITIGDFDRNGLLDIGAADNAGAGVFAWSDQGVRDSIGAWHAIASPQVTGTVNALGYGDFNRDGNLDVVMSRDVNAGLVAWLGDGGNSWTTCPITFTPGAQSGDWRDLAVGPFYRFAVEPDVIAASGNGSGLRYFGQAGTSCGYWYDLSIQAAGSFRGLSVGDIDHDGYDDIVAAPSDLINAGLRLWQGGVNGWTLFPNPTSTGNYYDTALGDFNNDGFLDIAAASDVDGIRVIKSNASIRSWTVYTVTTSGAYQAIAVGDLNNDGKLDIVAGANGSTNTGVDVWLGDGTFTTWTAWPSPDTTDQYFDLALGDVNHDGHLDILAGSENAGPRVWLGDGTGGWTLSTTALPATGSYFRSQFGPIDHDGNLDILATTPGGGLQMWTAAEATPPTINNFQPGGWITITQSPTITANVIDTGSGISVTSGLYRFSINGGSTWSAYAPASISGSTGSTSTQSMTAVNVPFGQDSTTQNRIEFRASDVVGNSGAAQATIKIDTVPPTAPTAISSSDHTINVWSNDNTISINWSGASDATSGVYAYSTLFDQNPATLPSAAVNAFAGSFTSGALADGNNWYAHVRTVDVAGNWSTTAIHLGPFKIDTVPPTNPTSVSSTDHTSGVWSADPTISMIWSGAADDASGVSGYSYVFDTSSGTLPDTVADTSGTSATSAALPSGNNKYVHIRTQDAAGNWSATAVHAGAYWIDVTPPSSIASSPGTVGSTSFFVSWSPGATDFGGSGIASYDVQYRDASTSGPWTTWQSFVSYGGAWFYGSGGHIYQFRSRARDNVGNLEAYPVSYDSQTGVATIDLYMRSPGIEVNQEVQDLNNSVILIANKRTFVRCYAQSAGGTFFNVPGRLRVYRNGGATYMGTLAPSNGGGSISVKSSPDRSQLNDAYYFDVPTGWLGTGSVMFQCEVNTPLKYADYNYGNDAGSVTVNFNPSPPMNLLIVDVPYRSGGVVQHVRNVDRTLLESYIRRAYPINSLTVKWAYLDPPYGSLPDAGTVDNDLFWDKFWNPFKFFPDFYARYYGMAIDNGGFMRGLAIGIPSTIAAGPAGVPGVNANPGGASGWDSDQSYGDWYGGHELGHTYGRYHAEFCGATGGAAYPYPNGNISPSQVQFNASTLYGFDTSTPTVIPPSWKDIMTYCSNEWLSDFTYEGIYNRMVAEKGVLQAQSHQQNPTASEHLVVTGRILTPTDVITLSTFFRVPNSLDSVDHISGTYHIRLLDVGNAQLLDYPFAPKFSPELDEPEGSIAEAVPWITGTHSIVILHDTTALITRTVSAHTPVITIAAPNGGELLSGSSYTVTWTASDADGDPLTYLLEYSADNGATWQLLGTNITQTQATIGLSLLPGTTQGLFRVWASDGVNTSFDASDAAFSVPFKTPSITSISPISGTTYVLSQTVTLEGSAFDAEDNVLGDAQLQWTSSLQGVLGTGSQLQVTDLITGTHVITLTATDSNNNTATATTVITVGEENPAGGSAPDLFLPIVIKNG